MRYVVFLRAINVGGRTVKKETLQETFRSLGFQDVVTTKQSGNVVFESDKTEPEMVRIKVEEKLCAVLGFKVAAFILTVEELKRVVEAEPFKGQESENSSFSVIFLPMAFQKFPLELPLNIPKSTAQVISAMGREVFSVTHGEGEGALPNSFLESRLKVKATTRNMNTVREIVEKYGSF